MSHVESPYKPDGPLTEATAQQLAGYLAKIVEQNDMRLNELITLGQARKELGGNLTTRELRRRIKKHRIKTVEGDGGDLISRRELNRLCLAMENSDTMRREMK